MRKALLWLLIAVMTLGCLTAVAPAEELSALNGVDVVNTGDDVYLAIPDAEGEGQMLLRVPLDGVSKAVCLDRGERYEDFIPYAGGAMTLKTDNGSSAVMLGKVNKIDMLYGFGGKQVGSLSVYNDDMLVLDDGLLYSIDPNTQVCLKLSSAQMLDYVLGDGCAYYLSGSDRLEYTAKLDDGKVASAQAGCVYRLDLRTGETVLLLKSGGEGLKSGGKNLFFHNMAEAYALRTPEETSLRGKLYTLDTEKRNLTEECGGPDAGYYPVGDRVAYRSGNVLKINEPTGAKDLYTLDADATVGSDGDALYVWEPQKNTLSHVSAAGTVNILYEGDLSAATDASLLLPEDQPTPTPTLPDELTQPVTTPAPDEGATDTSWFDNYVATLNDDGSGTKAPASGRSSGSGSGVITAAAPTPLAGASTPAPANFGDDDEDEAATTLDSKSGTSSSSTSSSKKTSSSSSSSSKSSSSSSTGSYKSGKYVKVVNGSAHIRSGPGLGYKVKTSVANGKYLTFKNRVSTDSRGVKWYKVSVNGSTGWISSRYSKVTNSKSGSSSSSSSSSTGKHVKTTGQCKIRSKASKTSKILGYMASGKTATYHSSKKDGRGVTWYKVTYKGITGWVSSKYSKRVS